MRCRRTQQLLLAFTEGELTQRKREQVATHVARCLACASVLRSMQQTLHMVQAMDVPEPSAAFWEEFGPALHQRLCQEAATPSAGRRFSIWDLLVLPKPVLTAVAVSLILVGFLPLLQWHRGQQAISSVVLSKGEEASLATDLDLLKNLDLLEEVELLENLDGAL